MKGQGVDGWTMEDEMELRFLESLIRRCPENVHLVRALADLYTRAGRYKDGLALDLKLAEQCQSDPDVWYNLACSQSLTGDYDAAFLSLYQALDLGYDNLDWLTQDEDLEPIRQDPRYPRLMAKMGTANERE